jgi:hypothetical protein
MRAKLSLVLYMLVVEAVAVYLVVFPVYAFQVSQSTTGWVRTLNASGSSAMFAASRSATIASIAQVAAGSTAASLALRLVAGAGWVGLGVSAGLLLYQLYYSPAEIQSLRDRAATPGAWTVAGVTGSILTVVSDNNVEYVAYGDGRISGGCSPTTANQLQAQGFTSFQTIELTAPLRAGPYCALGKLKASGGPHPVLGASTPATEAQLQTFVGGLPAADPLSVESNTAVAGVGAQPQPADHVVNQPVPASDVTTQVVPASQVQPTDVVVDPNATKPAGTVTNNTSTQTTTTTTTTVTNTDGSTTTQETDAAPVSCTSGNHEQRTFGGILQDHMDLWQGSGLLSALTLLKTLTWPTAIPTYSLQSNLLGNFTLDFSAWSGMLTAIRSIIIAIAAFVAYRMIFVGAR